MVTEHQRGMMKKALILLSGGVDSCVALALALERGLECTALSFDYGQRHRIELDYAQKVAEYYQTPRYIVEIRNESFNTSTLMKACPNTPSKHIFRGIADTYVPARNTLFLSYALGFAELFHSDEIHFGANASDLEGYPDCRPEYFSAFRQLIKVATKQSLTEAPPLLVTPLIEWDKKRIFQEGKRLNIPFEQTFSCYHPTDQGRPCLECLACKLRKEAQI